MMLVKKNRVSIFRGDKQVFLAHFLLFLCLPLAGVVSQFLKILISPSNKKNLIYLILILSVYLGFVNGTKVLESDLRTYYEYFKLVENKSFISYINQLDGRDSFFFVLTYLEYYFFGGSFWLYIVLSTSIMYGLYLSAIYKVALNSKISTRLVGTFLLCAAFLPDHFIWTGHVFRQMFAFSMIIYVAVSIFVENRFRLITAVLATFFHSSMLTFIAPAFFIGVGVRFFKSKISRIILLGIVVLFLFVLGYGFSTKIFDLLKETVIASRFSGDISDETGIDARTWLLPNIVLYFLAGLSVLIIGSSSTDIVGKKISLLYIFYFLVMMLFYSLGDFASLLSYRYLILVYGFIFLLLPAGVLFINSWGLRFTERFSTRMMLFLGFLFIGRFFYTLNNSSWIFASIPELLVNPWVSALLSGYVIR